MTRRFFVWLHRWTGLATAGFLIVVGVTGSLLAFNDQLEHLVTPQFYATPRPGVERLDYGALAEHAAALVPHGRVAGLYTFEPDRVIVAFSPREDPATGRPYDLGFTQFFLDPWTGEELGRRDWDSNSQGLVSLMPFIYHLHERLALGGTGMLVLGIVALVWTLDCFTGFYLTLPVAIAGFLARWKPAFLIKWPAGFFRLNFDLHRASGLWLWPMLFIFAWSSVFYNLPGVYQWVMQPVLGYKPRAAWFAGFDTDTASTHPNETPRLDWRAAEAAGSRLMAGQASNRGFTIVQPQGLEYNPGTGQYSYLVQSSRDLSMPHAQTIVVFDGDTGTLVKLYLPNRDRAGDMIDAWLDALHRADVFGLPYRIFVCVLGLVITMLSVTGVYIWWKKRRARRFSKAHRGVVAAEVVAE